MAEEGDDTYSTAEDEVVAGAAVEEAAEVCAGADEV